MPDVEKVIKGLECCDNDDCDNCPYFRSDDENDLGTCKATLHRDAISLLKTQEPADYIPIDWLMNYAQLPTEFAISAWRKPKKEAEIKQAKSLDKPMSLDDALALLKAHEPRVMTLVEVTEDRPDVVWFDDRHYKLTYPAFVSNGEVTGWVVSLSQGCLERHDHIDGYGKTWRCWTSRPTDEQREAIPWSD